MISFFIVWLLISALVLYVGFLVGLLIMYYFDKEKDRGALIRTIRNLTIAVGISTILWGLFFIITYYSMK
jgi:hypothetical protein